MDSGKNNSKGISITIRMDIVIEQTSVNNVYSLLLVCVEMYHKFDNIICFFKGLGNQYFYIFYTIFSAKFKLTQTVYIEQPSPMNGRFPS